MDHTGTQGWNQEDQTLICQDLELVKNVKGKTTAYHQLQREDHMGPQLDDGDDLLSKVTITEKEKLTLMFRKEKKESPGNCWLLVSTETLGKLWCKSL